jgi:predicted RND superfamily exporter protein
VSGPNGPELGRAIDTLAAAYRALPQVAGVIAGIRDGADMPLLDPEHVPAIVPPDRFPELQARLQPEAIATALAQVKKILAMPTGREMTERIRRDPLGLAIVAGETIRARYADPLAAATDPHILAPDGSAGLILLDPKGSPFDSVFTDGLFAALRRVEQDLRADPAFANVRVQYGGGYAHAHEDARLIKADVYRYTLLAFAAVIAIFQIGYRNLGILPLIGYQLAAGSLFAFGASVVIFRQLNALSFCFAAIFYGLAIDAVIYFYSRLLEERRTAPLDEAIVRTCAGIGAANLVASLTTAAAFAVIGLSALGAVAQIGVLTAVGMVVNVAHTFLVLPALVATFPGRLATRTPPSLDTPRLGAIAGASLRHPLPALAVSIAVIAGWLAFRPPLPVDANVLHLRANDSEASAAEDAIQAKFGGLAPEAQVLVEGRDLEDALEREERVVAWLEAHRAGAATPRIEGYQALSTFLPSRAAERARRAAFAALPLAQTREALHAELVRQGFRVDAFSDAERALAAPDAALPRDLDAAWIRPLVARHLRQTPHGAELAIMVSPAPGVALAVLRDRMRADLGDDVVVTGRSLMEAALDALISRELVGFTIASLALNLLIVLLQLRSIPLALAVMMPTGVIVLGMIEAMYALGIAFTPINLIVLPLTLGIGVDYCVYIVARWREGHDIASATRLVGRAAALTTMTTMAGFGFLAVSRYRGLAGLGWLAMIAIGLAFAAAVCVLPAWLAVMPRRLRPVADQPER